MQFHEEGDHSKGHSTKGSHSIHKKDEFEKKTEFFEEDHEGGESEKHGGYSHSEEYKKVNYFKSHLATLKIKNKYREATKRAATTTEDTTTRSTEKGEHRPRVATTNTNTAMTKKRATPNITPTKSNTETKRLKVLGKNGHSRRVTIMEAVKVKTSE